MSCSRLLKQARSLTSLCAFLRKQTSRRGRLLGGIPVNLHGAFLPRMGREEMEEQEEEEEEEKEKLNW